VEKKTYSVALLRPRPMREVAVRAALVACGNVLAVALLARGYPGFGVATFAAVVTIVGAVSMAPCTVEVSGDGVRLRWFRGRRFISITQIESAEMHVEPNRGGVMYWVRLRLRGEEPFEIGVGPNDGDKSRADAMAERVCRAVASSRS